jgi:cellulose biosynthesis protein BcsQ
MGSTIALLNQKGGVGKTTVTLGLASAAQAAGHTVLVVDLDPQGASSWVLGVDAGEVEVSTAELLEKATATDALYESSWGPGVDLIPASGRLQLREVGTRHTPERRLREALATVTAEYHAVLIDCPPSLGHLAVSALTAADHAVIVVDPAALGVRGISAVADLIDRVWNEHNRELDLAGVVVNRMPAVSAEAERQHDELARIVGRRAIWQPAVPQRVIVNQALGERRPIHSYGSRATDVAEAFDRLWAKLRRVTAR